MKQDAYVGNRAVRVNNNGRAFKPAAMMGLLLAASMLTPVSVMAAPASTPEAAPATLENIVVTARKRTENLQQVPISVTAITDADMQAKSLNSLEDVAQFTPNFSIGEQQQAGRSAGMAFIRGIGQTDAIITNDPGVGVYLDGVYLGRMQGIDLDMMDIERVEVLRGPQGTLFGKNTIGGAINVVSAKPDFKLGGKAQLTVGSYNRIDGVVILNVPVIQDKLAIKLSGATRNQDGYGHLLDTSGNVVGDMGNTKSLMGRAQILLKPAENFEALLSFDGTRIREQNSVFKLVAVATPPLIGLLNSLSNPPYDSRWITNSDFTSYATGFNYNNADVWGTSLALTWNTGPVTVKSISAYRKNKSDVGIDPDGSPFNLIDQYGPTDQHQFSQEFQFSGVALDNRLNWVAGLYYFSEDANDFIFDDVVTEVRTLIGLDLSFVTNIDEHNKSYAAYGQGTYSLTDKLKLTLGARYTEDKKNGDMISYSQYSGATRIPYSTQSASWGSFTPQAALAYQWTPDVMTYVSAANGFKSGGFNGEASTVEGYNSYGPEKVWTFEAGLRSDWLNKKLRFNATAFLSEYRDIQFTVIQGNANGQPSSVTDNAAAAVIKGGELELVTIPIPGLTLQGSLGLTDAKYTSVNPGASITTSTQFTYTPKWTGTLSAQYLVPIQDRFDVVGRVDYTYKSKIYTQSDNDPYTTQNPYGLVNARLTFESQDQAWSISAFSTNLTNKHYFTGGTNFLASLGFAQVSYAPPREWGGTFTYKF